MNQARVLAAAIDGFSMFRATLFPLRNVLNDIIRARSLNSRERKLLFDVAFSGLREVYLFHRFLKTNVRFASSLSLQQQDSLLLTVLLGQITASFRDNETNNLAVSYQNWKTEIGDNAALEALGPFISSKIRSDYGPLASQVAAGLFRKPAIYLAMDRRFVSKEEVSQALSTANVPYFFHPICPYAIGINQTLSLEVLPRGISDHIWFMDAGSQIVAHLVNPKPQDNVLDLCAGEGNKARLISAADCSYIAVDIDQKRLQKAKARFKNSNVKFVVADGRNPPFKANSFDWVLLDAPCSGSGTLARRPDLIVRLQQNELDIYMKTQSELLEKALELLKPQGILIYATCSLFSEENDQQIERVLTRTGARPLTIKDLGGRELVLPREELSKNSLTILPHINNCDGFFVAGLTK